jgi:hypothetical protein
VLTTLRHPHQQNEGDFISAVCYQKTENVILAANSRGLIQALQLK